MTESKIYIGAKLMLAPMESKESESKLKYPCTVIGINRKHRFFRVRFVFDYGSFTESFKYFEPGDCI